MNDLISQGITFLLPYAAGFFSALFIVALVGRAPAIILAPIARLLRQPIRLLVFVGRLFRRSPSTAVARNAAVGAKAELDRGLHHFTEIEAALRTDAPPGEDGTVATYDFQTEEKLLKRDGLLFRCIRVISDNYIPVSLSAKLTEEVASAYMQEASEFFSGEVPLSANEKSLYEDVEGAVIITLFRNSDRRCFYVLNEMRKTINGNIRMLMFVFCLLFVGVGAALVIIFTGAGANELREKLPLAALLAGSAGLLMSATSTPFPARRSSARVVLMAARPTPLSRWRANERD